MESDLTRLVFLVLLAMDRKRASKARIRRAGDRCLVELVVDDATQVEMDLEAALHGPIIRRLAVMASLPMHAKGQFAQGSVVIENDSRRLGFDVRVQGHSAELEAWLRPATGAGAAT